MLSQEEGHAAKNTKKKDKACGAIAPRSTAGKTHRRIRIALQLIMLLGLAGAIYEFQWFTAFLIASILVLAMLPGIVARRFAVQIPAELDMLVVVFVFASLFLGEVRGYYVRFWWWDVVLHTGSGFLLGIAGFLLVYVLNKEERVQVHMKPGFIALFSFTFAMALGGLWEILEFAMDGIFGLNMQKSGLVDTMWDLIVDALSALAIASLGYAYMKSGTEYFVQRWIARFIQENPKLFRGDNTGR